MGKAKKLRTTSHKKRVPPTGGPTQAEIEQAQQEDYNNFGKDEAAMFKGLVDLQGSIREATCVAIATMFGDSYKTEEEEKKNRDKLQAMVDKGLLKKLIPRIVDPMKMVRLHAIGALRNISVTGGIDICEYMTTQNVITPLIRIISEHTTKNVFDQNDLPSIQLIEQAIALLYNLCESCQAAINELTRGNLLDPIMLGVEFGRNHLSYHIELLKLLLLITENNPYLNELFGQSAEYQRILGELLENPQLNLYAKLHSIGIAMNVRAIMEQEQKITKLLPFLENALTFDAVNVIQFAQQASNEWKFSQKTLLEDESNLEDETLHDEDRERILHAQAKVKNWKENVQILNLALELVADLSAQSTEEEEEEEEEEWASDDEDAMENYAITATQQMDISSGENKCNSPVFFALSKSSAIYTKVLTIFQALVSIPPSITERAITLDFERIRIRVVNALNNLVQNFPLEFLGGKDQIIQIFHNLCTLYHHIKQQNIQHKKFDFCLEDSSVSNDLETAITASMFAILRRSKEEKIEFTIQPEEANLIMTNALQKSNAMETRLHCIGMIGCVGQRIKNLNENQVIGQCLLQNLNDSNLEIVTEVLNALFDIYAEEDLDENFKKLQFLTALETTSKAIKCKLKAESKQFDRDFIAHVKETLLNLVRFIKYKKKHLK